MKKIKYYYFSFLSFLLSLIGVLGIRMIILLVAIEFGLYTENYIGKNSLILGFIVGLLVGGVLWIGFEKLLPLIDKFDNLAESYKQYPYTEKYGKDYPHPKSSDFGITQDEFNSYNKRFQFEFIKIIFTYGIVIAANFYVLGNNLKNKVGLSIVISSILIGILLEKLFNYINQKISKKHSSYDKIHKYQQALSIYFRVRDENFKI